jgi:hypothetical protein
MIESLRLERFLRAAHSAFWFFIEDQSGIFLEEKRFVQLARRVVVRFRDSLTGGP